MDNLCQSESVVMANLLPESFQLVQLLVWLAGGIIGAALAGLAAGVIPRKRQRSVGPGRIAGFVTAATILLCPIQTEAGGGLCGQRWDP